MGQERVLLIGGAGFVGSALTAALHAAGHQVTVFDAYRQFSDPFSADYSAAMAYRHEQLGPATILRGDACDQLDLLAAFETARPHRVVHLAAVARAPLNEQHPAEAIHTATCSVTNSLLLAGRFDVRRVLVVSSSYVYGDFQYLPCDETHPTTPTTVYGAAKLSAEVIARALSASTAVPVTIARMIAVYGPWDLNGKLSAPNLAAALRTGELPIADPPGSGTDYTHIDDAARGLGLALFADKAGGETINISRGRARTADEVAGILGQLGCDVRVTANLAPAGRPRRGPLSIERATTLIGYEPNVDLEDGLAECVRHAVGARPAGPGG